MKLRIKGNAIRYRLSKTDIQTLEHVGIVQEEIDFGPAMLSYSLHRADYVKEMTAGFENNNISINISEEWATELINTERVGFETYAEVGDGKILYILIEKDFKCLDEGVQEDQGDSFENPVLNESNEGNESNESIEGNESNEGNVSNVSDEGNESHGRNESSDSDKSNEGSESNKANETTPPVA